MFESLSLFKLSLSGIVLLVSVKSNLLVFFFFFFFFCCKVSKDSSFIASFNRIPNFHLTLSRYVCFFSRLMNLIF